MWLGKDKAVTKGIDKHHIKTPGLRVYRRPIIAVLFCC
jgi:hypothetical protein